MHSQCEYNRRRREGRRKLTKETSLRDNNLRRQSKELSALESKLLKARIQTAIEAKPHEQTAQEFWEALSVKSGGVSVARLKKLLTKKQEAKLHAFISSGPRRGRHRTWRRHLSTSVGCRFPRKEGGRLGRPSPMAPLVNEVKIWNKWELGAAHEISPPDLYDEFDMRLSDEIEHLQEVKASRKLNDAEAKWLQTCENKKHSLRIVDNKRQWTQSLAAWCHISFRAPGNVVPFTPQEMQLFISLGWQAFDKLWLTIAKGSEQDLQALFAEVPKIKRERIPLMASDAVPVYPSPSTGRIAVPWDLLDQRQARSYRKKNGLPVAILHN